MNWKEALRRVLIIFAVVTVWIGALKGWEDKEPAYIYLDESGAWLAESDHCLPNTFERNHHYNPNPLQSDGRYRYTGDCRTAKSIFVGILFGFLPPLALLLIYFLVTWVFNGLRVEPKKL